GLAWRILLERRALDLVLELVVVELLIHRQIYPAVQPGRQLHRVGQLDTLDPFLAAGKLEGALEDGVNPALGYAPVLLAAAGRDLAAPRFRMRETVLRLADVLRHRFDRPPEGDGLVLAAGVEHDLAAVADDLEELGTRRFAR